METISVGSILLIKLCHSENTDNDFAKFLKNQNPELQQKIEITSETTKQTLNGIQHTGSHWDAFLCFCFTFQTLSHHEIPMPVHGLQIKASTKAAST